MHAAVAAIVAALFATHAELPEPQGRFAFRSYGSEQGLANLSVVAIQQDGEGFLWVATEDGLYRYDGDRFHRFAVEDGLPANGLTTLAVGSDGRLWAGTFRGVARFENGAFRAVAQKTLPDVISGMAAAPTGELWVATAAGLFVERGADRFAPAEGWPKGQGAVSVWADARGVVAGAQGGVWLEKGGHWRSVSTLGQRIDAVVRDRRGTVWARSAQHLFSLGEGEEALRDHSRLLPGASEAGYLSLDPQGALWVPTDGGILYREDDEWRVLGPSEGLPASWARVATQDREGSIWIGVTGLHRLVGRGLWHVYSTREGLPSEVVWTEWRDRKGALYVGTDKGLARANGNRFELVPGTKGHAVRAVAQTGDGALWLGGSPPEIIRMDSSGRIDRFGAAAGVGGEKVLTLLATSRGELLAGTFAGGLLRWNGARFAPVALPGGSVRERVSHLIEDRQGRIWAAGELGLAVQRKGEWQRVSTAEGLRDDRVSYLLERRSGDICVSYFESLGFTCFQPTARGIRAVTHVDTSKGLSNGRVYQLGEDGNGRLWVGTGQGADVFDAHGVEHFGQARGMAGDDCDATAFLADGDGDVWIGTSTGLSRFIGGNYAGPPEPPRAAIVEAHLGATRLRGKQRVSVEERDGILEVHFAGLSFLDEARVQHQVRLLPLEPEFRTSVAREARYSALRPGHYAFEVRARMPPGQWSEPARLEFTLLPQWWQTIWFRLALASAAAGAGAGLLSLRVRHLKRRNRELEQQVGLRTSELAAANQALRDLSVRDPLTGLKNRRYLELTMPETVAQSVRAQRGPRAAKARNSDLVLLVVDLDDFKSVNDTYGHAAGDRVLQQAGQLVAQACRESDSAVRWGGEEFVLVARNADRAEAGNLAERICELFRAHPFEVGSGQTLSVTCSVGLAAFPFAPAADLAWSDVLELADRCLYAAKRAGKDCWAMAHPGPRLRAEGLAQRLAAHFPQLVADGELSLTLSRGDLPMASAGRS